MILIKYYEIDEISQIEQAWQILQEGQDMSYFQQYDWYKSVSDTQGKIKGNKFHAFYAVVERDGLIILIAPLWIVKEAFHNYPKGIYIFGGSPYPDYLNFIYKNFDEECCMALLNDVSKKYNVYNYKFEELKYPSALYDFVTKQKVIYEYDSVCVHINIDKTREDYESQLSKNARQNIRTAINRAHADQLELLFCSDDKELKPKIFNKYRRQRHLDKGYLVLGSYKKRLKHFIKQTFFAERYFELKKWDPFFNDKNSHFMTLRTRNGKLCAAFNYGIEKDKNAIVVMTVSTNSAYSRYSPGMITMYEFILKQIKCNGIKTVDFTRGNEHYKYALGGEDHFNKVIEFVLDVQSTND